MLGKGETEDDINDDLVWSDENLKHVFKRLFEFALEFPQDLYGDFR